MVSGCLLSQTLYTATLSNNIRIKITNRFLDFYGTEYVVLKQYIRRNSLFLSCFSETDNHIISIPVSYTDYMDKTSCQNMEPEAAPKEYFPLDALAEAYSILQSVSYTHLTLPTMATV